GQRWCRQSACGSSGAAGRRLDLPILATTGELFRGIHGSMMSRGLIVAALLPGPWPPDSGAVSARPRASCRRRHRFWKSFVADAVIRQISRGIRPSHLAALCRQVGWPNGLAKMSHLVLALNAYGDAGGALTKARHAISRLVALTEPRPEAKLQPGCAE